MSRISILVILSFLSVSSLADVRFSNTFVDMGRVRVNSSTFRSIYLRNTGTETVNVNVSENCFSGFWISNSCIGQLSPGMSCNIGIRFSPQRDGYQSCTINARDSQGGWDRASISGTGYDDRRRR